MATDTLNGRRVLSDIELEQLLARQPLERGMFARLLPLLGPVRAWVAGAVLLELGVVAANFARPWFVRQAIDTGWVPGHGQALALALPIGGLLVAWAARFALAGAAQYLGGVAATRLLNDLRVRLFEHVQTLSVGWFDRSKAGRIIARIDRDVDTLEPLVVQGPPELLSALLRLGGAAAWLAWLSPALLGALAALLPPLALASLSFKRISMRNHVRTAEARSRFTAHLVETVAGVRVLQQQAQEPRNRTRYRALLQDFAKALIRGHVTSGWFAPFAGWLTAVGTVLVLAVGAQELAAGRLTLGDLAAAMLCVQLFLGPVQELSDLFEKYGTAAASAQRIFLVLDTQPEIVDAAVPVALPAVRGAVHFDDVSFRYDPAAREPVLDRFTLHVAAGERLAIVGRTGHGKSTLVQLVTRFHEAQQGRVSIDGVDVRHLAQHALRRHVGVVLQDNVLFSGSVLDNLRLARPGLTEAGAAEAAAALGVQDLVERLPQGWHTPVGALGAHLSHGQRQVVCLLRAFLADPAVLILDEATSAVDVQTERRLQQALRRLCAGRTAIVIAHRLATVADADRVVVVERGRIVEQGPPAELLAAGGPFAAFAAAGALAAA